MKKSEITKEMQSYGKIYAKVIEQLSEEPALQVFMRDWFAAQAITSFIHDATMTQVAKHAYDIADAMMKERANRVKTKKHAAL